MVLQISKKDEYNIRPFLLLTFSLATVITLYTLDWR
jgi:hypothetical protein